MRDVIVDHSRPIHDSFCRCQRCKPSLAHRGLEPTRRVEIALLGALVATVTVWLFQ